MDVAKRAALSNFYREEFLPAHRVPSGLRRPSTRATGGGRPAPAARSGGRLDELCCLEHFPVLAETVLQSFDALSRLSHLDPRQPH